MTTQPTTTTLKRHLVRALGIASAIIATTLVPAPAFGDSIVYIKGGDVWAMTPDGTRQQQVTHTGKYFYVSQADDGSMIALAPNERLHRLSRTGHVLADFPTMVSDGLPVSGPVNKFGGPFEPQISPDGKLVAFEWYNDSYSSGGANCNSQSVPPCYVLSSRKGVAITYSDRLTGHEEFGLLTGWGYPHWMSNDRLLRSSPGAIMNENTVFNQITAGAADQPLKRWFFDANGGRDVYDVVLSRDKRVAVGVVGSDGQQMRVYRPLYDPYDAPEQKLGPFDTNTPVVEPCYAFNGPTGKFNSPSLSLDGRNLAFATDDGVWVAGLPDVSTGCQMGASTGTLVAPGGTFPHWGPADLLPASAYTTGSTPVDQTPKPTTNNSRRALRVRIGQASLAQARSRGVLVTITSPVAGRMTVTARSGPRVVGRRTNKRAPVGTSRMRVRLRLAAKGAKQRSVKIAVALTPASGGKRLTLTVAARVGRR